MRDLRIVRKAARDNVLNHQAQSPVRRTFTGQGKVSAPAELSQLPAANLAPIQVNDITDPNFGLPIFMVGYSALGEGEPLG